MAQTVRVNLGERSYDIAIGTNHLDAAATFLIERRKVTHAIVITDAHVEQPHAALVVRSLSEAGIQADLLVVDPGEESKSVEVANFLWEKLLDLGADRRTVVVAVGGGVVGDLAGFVAAAYARGLALLQIPTSLLAQVDSSVGGKVGVNLPHAKNMVGAFWQPLGVIIDTAVLATLPDREYRSGLAEVVKYGMIMDEEFFEYLEQHTAEILRRDPATLETVIARCCRLKADVVEEDEQETKGRRAILNYGHTFGHALEAVTDYSHYLHGEAVSIGMECAARLAERLGRIDQQVTRRQSELLAALGLPVTLRDVEPRSLLDAMMHDKKVEHGLLRFVLPSGIGHVELVGDVDAREVQAALAL